MKKGYSQNRQAKVVPRDACCCRRWAQTIKPLSVVVIAPNAGRLLVIIKNIGTAPVVLSTGYQEQHDIAPGDLRVFDTYGTIALRNKEKKSAAVEMEFMPRPK